MSSKFIADQVKCEPESIKGSYEETRNAFGDKKRIIVQFIQVNQEKPVRFFHCMFHKFTKLKDYLSVFNVRER